MNTNLPPGVSQSDLDDKPTPRQRAVERWDALDEQRKQEIINSFLDSNGADLVMDLLDEDLDRSTLVMTHCDHCDQWRRIWWAHRNQRV